MDGLDDMLKNSPWFIWNNLLILKKWHPDENLLKKDVSIILVWVKLYGDRSSYARVMIELRADVELKDNIVVAMPKITREGHYTCNVRVEYEWKPPRCSHCKVFGNIHEECLKNTGASENKTVKKPSQTSRGFPVGPKIGFKPHKEYRHVPKKSTASSSGNNKKGEEPIIEVSNSNPFDVLNSVDNDVELGTNGGTTNLVNNGATSSGSSFMNVDNSSSGTTPIIEKIRKGFDTQSLLEQWRDSYGNGDYDDDPYDDDMYEGQDLSHELQAIRDNLDIRVRRCKKK
ncbi:RNA-directed DNA polymerase, eukaryota, reverse transcriptase zinc-binding domain protein [Tanacetum coccineum]